MQVIIPTNGDYNKNIREFIRFGGKHAQSAKKAAELEVKLRTGVDVRSMTTDHGESRIKGCIKYDLGNGFRMVTVQQGEVVILLAEAPLQPAPARDALIEFFERHKPEVLNGILVVPTPSGATQWELARALGYEQTGVSLACQRQDYFVPPNRPLPNHIIHGVCDYFRCAANIIRRS